MKFQTLLKFSAISQNTFPVSLRQYLNTHQNKSKFWRLENWVFITIVSNNCPKFRSKMGTSLSFSFLQFFALLLLLAFPLQALATESVSKLKLNSKILQDDIISKVNTDPTAGWKAGVNDKFSDYTVAQFKHLLGARPTPLSESKDVPTLSHARPVNLPKEFDARKTWPQCSTIGRILDQGHCGSCWAFAAVEALSDRFCINFGMNVSLSVNDLLACCGIFCGSGCNGGIPLYAWRYFVHHGVVTEECDPYFDSTGCSHPGCEPAYPTPTCVRKCVDGNQLWKTSKHFGHNAYKIHAHPEDIMTEVYKNGPVEVDFDVYEDFAHYKSGVYKHVTGDYLGGHAVKLIGWGTTADGEDYWLVANQWNKSWGDDGYFKIRRGTNECGIEHGAVAGIPSSRNLIKAVGEADSDRDASA